MERILRDRLFTILERNRPGAATAIFVGFIIALAAIAMRVAIGPRIGGDQIIFSYPAIVFATLLFGMRAGTITAVTCLMVAWYLVVPIKNSFVLQDGAAVAILAVDILVSSALLLSIGTMRAAASSYRKLSVKLEDMVAARTTELNRLWRNGIELVAILAEDGSIETINPSFANLLAASAAQMKGRPFVHLLSENDSDHYHNALRALGLGNRSAIFDARMQVPGRTVWVNWSAVHDDNAYYLVGRDVTAEHLYREQLVQSQKVEAVGQMTGGLAHDFANLLSPIVMGLDLIRTRHKDDARTIELMDSALESANRAHELVSRLLSFSRRQEMTKERIDIGKQLAALEPLLLQTIGKRVLKIDVTPDLPGIVTNPNEIDMVLLNLAANARDATEPDSTICVEARNEGQGLSVRFSDTGNGMDAETLAHAADPFFSTKAEGEGTGLGLAMAQEFARRHGGSLHIASKPSEGTTVTLTLPSMEREHRAKADFESAITTTP